MTRIIGTPPKELIVVETDEDTRKIWAICQELGEIKGIYGNPLHDDQKFRVKVLEQDIEILRKKYKLEDFKLQ